MPEADLGHFPDVGASYFLSRLPGFFGNFTSHIILFIVIKKITATAVIHSSFIVEFSATFHCLKFK
uniref:3-hydroxybutyryl-CoA dehydratase n=1 Tax=Solanum tuberosum TaxID=4113 RepID=M1CFK0_SOLTU